MSENPYNSLGQILSMGGEITLGLAIANGWNSSRITALFQRRFAGLSQFDQEALTDIAVRGYRAGDQLNEDPPVPPSSRLPAPRVRKTDPTEDPQPSWYYVVKVGIDGTDEAYDIRINSDKRLDKYGIDKLAREWVVSNMKDSPPGFAARVEDDETGFYAEVKFEEARY